MHGGPRGFSLFSLMDKTALGPYYILVSESVLHTAWLFCKTLNLARLSAAERSAFFHLKMHKVLYNYIPVRNSTFCLYDQGAFLGHFSKMHNNLANYEENLQEFFTSCCVFLDREKQKRTLNKIRSI